MKNILIIHTAFVGDIILSTPMIKKIKKKYPESKIVYLTTGAGRAVLNGNPLLDEIIVYDKRGKDKGISGIFKMSKKLKEYNFDIAIIPHRYLRSSLLAFLAGIKLRIGYENSEGRLFLNKKIKYDKSLHEVDKLLNFVDLDNFKDKKIELYPSNEDKKKIDELWKKYYLKNKKIIVISPGSKWFTKMWPLNYFNELIEKLDKLENIKIIISGGKEEEKFNIYKSNNVINLIGKTTLLELAEILNRADILVSNDSSPLHLASAFNTYIIAIFGATVKELGFYPWSKNSILIENNNLDCRPCGLHGGNTCPKVHFKCMLDIKSEIVYKKILSHFEREKNEITNN